MSQAVDASIKVFLLGDSGVGKSSLMLSFASGTFDPDISSTIGIDFKVKNVEVMDANGVKRNVNIHLWDTAGQERFRTLTSSYYRGANAVVLVYDVNEPQTFHGLQRWMEEADVFCRNDDEDDAVYLLIGNKIDKCVGGSSEGEGAPFMSVPKEQAQQLAQRRRMLLAFTSAKTRAGVEQAFDELARTVYDKIRVKGSDYSSGINFNKPASEPKSSSCC
ncbi:small GTP-binding protein Rab18, putative [Trypanosoma cruzi]|uniref:Small GTP-binding protein Rab18 n=2 Tax=Trypanosoma cruzi TaxID=5693 RepID=V5D027_TRYCR|nr:small GTP-binding protein Rab18, putative [Trypanosoma cruzi]ESS60846.1 small GTP-binding protein Rab18 [Trypanosoma cruzi Dm28c]PBJ72117.1 small GTP-binding protein Rab18 [Trypanosoma cruzi cruzi]RNF22711.1 putative small GTP-binding protein Rab18 [Trypanosoma cruzi]